ncbi:methylenetetrahydrofolate reductase [NAD(P)H] [Drancourtella sp. An177]|nr:methylenetetrahydrofolate reductase [NAD(P)H] [Drancourtella sp. An177]
MKIKEKLYSGGVHISFEVFPPKTDDKYESVKKAVDEIAKVRPSFISVTYGAGGGTSKNTVGIASHIQNDLGVPSIAHLTCVSSTKSEVKEVVRKLKDEGIQNILALRGDIPDGMEYPAEDKFRHAEGLIRLLKEEGDFCIGGACYPEGHVESPNQKEDIRYLKEKVDCGLDFLTTQMFFDNHILYNFLYKIREAGITVPVLPGIMPVTNKNQIKRICSLSGTYLPERFKAIVDRFGDHPAAMQQAGVAYATDQIIDLIANGIDNIHVYSMNKPEIARAIMANLSEIVNG